MSKASGGLRRTPFLFFSDEELLYVDMNAERGWGVLPRWAGGQILGTQLTEEEKA